MTQLNNSTIHSLSTRYDYMMPCPNTPTRQSLSRSVGRLVTCEATYLEQQRQWGKKKPFTLCGWVIVYPYGCFAHLWVDLPEGVCKRLTLGAQFWFRGRVVEYRRGNLTWDYAIDFVEWMKGL